MDDCKEETKFGSLPLQVQLDIFKKLNWTDRKNSRLTSTDWFSFINFVQKFSFTISDNQGYYKKNVVLKSPFNFYSRIALLRVMDVVKPLPIYSSTRMDVPRAEKLGLCQDISEDNILKLLRYYAVGCKTLSFEYSCFGNVVNAFRMKIDVVLLNITKFRFQHGFDNSSRAQMSLFSDECNRTRALSEFLAATSMPNLKTLEVYLEFMDILDFGDNSLTSVQALVKNFGIFIEKHGQFIVTLLISYEGRFHHGLFQLFLKLPNVVDLTCWFDFDDVDLSDPSVRLALWTTFTSYKKLKSFTSSFRADSIPNDGDGWIMCNQFTTMMLENNQHSLTNLSVLELDMLYIGEITLFSNQFPLLRELEVVLSPRDPEDVDVAESDSGSAFIHWIIQVGPRLEYLTLGSKCGVSILPPLAHIRTLLLGLHELKYMKIINWKASEEAKLWLNSQSSIEYKHDRLRGWFIVDCDIFIKRRPFTETNAPAD